jgi:hypothetical protein
MCIDVLGNSSKSKTMRKAMRGKWKLEGRQTAAGANNASAGVKMRAERSRNGGAPGDWAGRVKTAD